MALCSIRFKSGSLGKQSGLNVLLPDKGNGPFPVLYLLHGNSEDYTSWLRETRIERDVRGLGLIVVMPDGGRSRYVNSDIYGHYEDHIIKSVIRFVDHTFPTIAKRPTPRGTAC